MLTGEGVTPIARLVQADLDILCHCPSSKVNVAVLPGRPQPPDRRLSSRRISNCKANHRVLATEQLPHRAFILFLKSIREEVRQVG